MKFCLVHLPFKVLIFTQLFDNRRDIDVYVGSLDEANLAKMHRYYLKVTRVRIHISFESLRMLAKFHATTSISWRIVQINGKLMSCEAHDI